MLCLDRCILTSSILLVSYIHPASELSVWPSRTASIELKLCLISSHKCPSRSYVFIYVRLCHQPYIALLLEQTHEHSVDISNASHKVPQLILNLLYALPLPRLATSFLHKLSQTTLQHLYGVLLVCLCNPSKCFYSLYFRACLPVTCLKAPLETMNWRSLKC